MNGQQLRFEQRYFARCNTFGFLFLALHVPVLLEIAACLNRGIGLTLGVGTLLLIGPGLLLLSNRGSELCATALGVSAMGFSSLAIHLSGGMIEAHFHIFTALALLTVFGRMTPILAAAGTIAVQHVVFWLWLPASVFNYQASFEIVLLHAFFVVLETVPACWIARQFGLTIRARAIVEDKLSLASKKVSSSAIDVQRMSNDLATRAKEQAAALEQNNTAILQLRSRSDDSAKISADSIQVMGEIDAEVGSARTSLSALTAGMLAMMEASQRIEGIAKLVDDIAFQTNILALNASVEAARAGEAGLGFAVVASEVRNLSQRSAKAANETKDLIESAISETSRAEGLTKDLAAQMDHVTQSTRKARAQSTQIQQGSSSQFEAARQISDSVAQLQKLAEFVANNAGECASTGAVLTEQAKDLNQIVIQLGALR